MSELLADDVRGTVSELQAAMKADRGKPDAKQVRDLLRLHPELWRLYDIADSVQTSALDAGKVDAITRELIISFMNGLKRQMGYYQSPMHEQMLISAVCLAWLRYYMIEYSYSNATAGSVAITQAAWWERRLSVAQVRYLRAIETLARVRRLGVNVQVNIAAAGGQQINQQVTTP